MAGESAVLDDVANELEKWPGVHLERRADGTVAVRYHDTELGILYPAQRVAELPFLGDERDGLIEHGDAGPATATPDSTGVGHELRGPSDVTEVLDLFDRRYRDVRGDDDPASA